MSCVNKTTVVDPKRFSRLLESIKTQFFMERESVELYNLGIKIKAIKAKFAALY